MDMEVVRQAARAKLATLEGLQEEITKQKAVCLAVLEMVDNDSTAEWRDKLQQALDETDSVRHRPDSHTATMNEAIQKILSDEGGRLHRKEILRRITLMGIHVGGAKPLNTLSSHLSAGKQFKPVGGGYWELIKPATAAVSSPADEAQQPITKTMLPVEKDAA